jgi:hypothetical protein
MVENGRETSETDPDNPGKIRRDSASDFFAGAVIFLIGAYALYESVNMPFFGDSGVWGSPGLTPGLIASVLLLLSAMLMFRSRGFALRALSVSGFTEIRRGGMTLALIVVYIAVMPWIGYATATFIMLFVFQVLFTSRRDWRFVIVWALGLSAVLTAALYYLFAEIFLIPLP